MQVFDLSVTKPSDFVQYGLAFLERLADLGDYCAKATRENLRVMVCRFKLMRDYASYISALSAGLLQCVTMIINFFCFIYLC